MLFNKKEIKPINEICEKCGTVNQFKMEREGIEKMGQTILLIICSLIFCVLFLPLGLVILIVGLIYIFTQKKLRFFKVCTACNRENTALNLDTPKGKRLFEENLKDLKNVVQDDQKKQ